MITKVHRIFVTDKETEVAFVSEHPFSSVDELLRAADENHLSDLYSFSSERCILMR